MIKEKEIFESCVSIKKTSIVYVTQTLLNYLDRTNMLLISLELESESVKKTNQPTPKPPYKSLSESFCRKFRFKYCIYTFLVEE